MASDAYLRLDGMKGESQDHGHAERIEVSGLGTPACHLIQLSAVRNAGTTHPETLSKLWHLDDATDKTNVRRTAWEPD